MDGTSAADSVSVSAGLAMLMLADDVDEDRVSEEPNGPREDCTDMERPPAPPSDAAAAADEDITPPALRRCLTCLKKCMKAW